MTAGWPNMRTGSLPCTTAVFSAMSLLCVQWKCSVFFRTASKIAWRELHAAPAKFFFVILAVAVGVGALSGVKGFGYAFKGMLLRNAKQLIAGDVQAQTWNLPTSEQIDQIKRIAKQYGTLTRVT